MLDIGIQELLVIMVLALLIFGPDKLPELGRRLGRAMREFRRASDEFRSTVETNLQFNVDPDISSPSPAEATPASAEASSASEARGGTGDDHAAGTPPLEPAAPSVIEGQAPDDQLEPYWTSRGGRLLHRRECAWRSRVPASERIPLKAAADGWDQGLKPCPACDPKEAEVAS
jgi:sec-independent protein translocase protein TatA